MKKEPRQDYLHYRGLIKLIKEKSHHHEEDIIKRLSTLPENKVQIRNRAKTER